MPEHLPEMSRYRFKKSARLNAETETALTQEVASYNSPEVYGLFKKGELGRFLDTEKHREAFFEIMENQLRWIESRLGVSVRSRFPDIDKVYTNRYKIETKGAMRENFARLDDVLYEDRKKKNPQTDYTDAWAKRGAWLDSFLEKVSLSAEFDAFMVGNRGIQTNAGEIVVRTRDEQYSSEDVYHALSHEILHALSYNQVKFNSSQDVLAQKELPIPGVRSGYANTIHNKKGDIERTVFAGWNEFVTETVNGEVLDFQKKNLGSDWTAAQVSYAEGVIFLDRIRQLFQEKVPDSAAEYTKNIFRGYFTGDIKSLAFFDEVFGVGTLAALSRIKGSENVQELADILKNNFGDPTDVFRETLDAWYMHQSVTLSSGIRIQ